MKYTCFKDIPQLPRGLQFMDIDWTRLEDYFKKFGDFDTDPEYQRGYCWTSEQKRDFIEFCLRGGRSASTIYWNLYPSGLYELVDGKQRLDAVLGFMNNRVPAFGSYYSQFTDKLSSMVDIRFAVNHLQTRSEVVEWYIAMNTGGSRHTEHDLSIARECLEQSSQATQSLIKKMNRPNPYDYGYWRNPKNFGNPEGWTTDEGRERYFSDMARWRRENPSDLNELAEQLFNELEALR